MICLAADQIKVWLGWAQRDKQIKTTEMWKDMKGRQKWNEKSTME